MDILFFPAGFVSRPVAGSSRLFHISLIPLPVSLQKALEPLLSILASNGPLQFFEMMAFKRPGYP